MDFQLATTYKPQGDQPRAIGELVSGLAAGEKDQVLLGVTGSGKTFTMAKVIAELQPPRAHPRAQQDPRRAALPRVQTLLPHQRRRVLRLLLRLLPARGLHPLRRPLHREGSHHQRGARQAPPLRHPLPLRTPRLHHRLLRLLHLRPRLARSLLRHAAAPRKRPEDQARRHHPPPRRNPLRAQRRRLPPRHLPRPRRRHRDLPHLRRKRLPHRALRRRDRLPLADRSALRHRPPEVLAPPHLSQSPTTSSSPSAKPPPSTPSSPSSASGRPSSKKKAASSSRSASTSAPASTSR